MKPAERFAEAVGAALRAKADLDSGRHVDLARERLESAYERVRDALLLTVEFDSEDADDEDWKG